MYYCIRVLYLTCPRIRSFVFWGHGEGWRNTERRCGIGVEIKSSLFLHPHQSHQFDACRISHQYLFREQLHWHWSREEKRTCDVCIHIHLLESRRGKATYSMIGCLNQSVLPSSSAPAFLSNPCPVTMHSSGLPLTSVHDSRVELIRWSCTSNIYPSLIFSQSNYQPNARKSLHQRKAQTYVSSNVFCVLSVLTMIIVQGSIRTLTYPYIPITQKPLCTTIGANMRSSPA